MKTGFLAKWIDRWTIECPRCSKPVRESYPPSPSDPDGGNKSIYICRCEWESNQEVA